jgi:hypothetical protein
MSRIRNQREKKNVWVRNEYQFSFGKLAKAYDLVNGLFEIKKKFKRTMKILSTTDHQKICLDSKLKIQASSKKTK